MVAQLIRQDDGSYDYEEVDTRKKAVTSNVTEFEAYEGAKKGGEDLVSEPSITEQTEKIQREIPSRVEFDEKTGTFITKKAESKYLEYKEPERTAESTEETALQKVMKMSGGTGQEPIDYKQIMKDAYQATRPSWKEQAISSAFDVGGKVLTNYITKKVTGSAGDMAINYMTQNVLGKTLSGRLATGSGLMQGATMSPYVLGASLLMDKKIGGKVLKKGKKVLSKAADFITGGKVVCTAMYQTTQLPEWKKHIRVWQIFERKHLTPYHEIGYHVLFKPFAKGMLKNSILKNIGAHIAKHRTQDLKSILFNSKKDLLGRVYRIILEPICYIVGRIKSWQ